MTVNRLAQLLARIGWPQWRYGRELWHVRYLSVWPAGHRWRVFDRKGNPHGEVVKPLALALIERHLRRWLRDWERTTLPAKSEAAGEARLRLMALENEARLCLMALENDDVK